LIIERSVGIAVAGAVLALTIFSVTANAEDAEAGKDAAKPPEPKMGWEGSFNLGLTATTGNSNTSTGNVSLDTKLTRPESITRLGASDTYGKSGSESTADKSNAFINYNYLFTERFSGYLQFEWERDRIADLVWRINTGPGVGYFLIKEPTSSLAGQLGVSYIREKFENVKFDDYYALRIAERGELKISPTTKLWEQAEYLPDISNFEKRFILKGEAGVEAAMTAKTSLRLLVQDTFNSMPAPGRNKNDATYIAGIGYKF